MKEPVYKNKRTGSCDCKNRFFLSNKPVFSGSTPRSGIRITRMRYTPPCRDAALKCTASRSLGYVILIFVTSPSTMRTGTRGR